MHIPFIIALWADAGRVLSGGSSRSHHTTEEGKLNYDKLTTHKAHSRTCGNLSVVCTTCRFNNDPQFCGVVVANRPKDKNIDNIRDIFIFWGQRYLFSHPLKYWLKLSIFLDISDSPDTFDFFMTDL